MVLAVAGDDTRTMATPSHDRLRDLLAAYALGAVDEDESRILREHLGECAECRRELRRLQEAALRLFAAEAPSPTLWERILRRIVGPPHE